MIVIPEMLRRILQESPELRRSYLVGGCVRDALLGIPVKDIDIEVYGLTYVEVTRVLWRWGKADIVGRSFGVVKLMLPNGETYDFSLPRRDSKVAPGHKGFVVSVDPGIEPAQAAARRDFTINALMADPFEGKVLDFFGGQEDLRHRVLRHVSEAFPEDPLRVLRGMQFAGRFNLTAAPETAGLCRSIRESFRELARDRVREEWLKWATRSTVPSAGLKFLQASGWIDHFPELAALAGVPQEPEWHPEGDVWTHTLHSCDAMARLPDWQAADEASRAAWMLAALTHDLGKAVTTREEIKDGVTRLVSPEHAEKGVPLAEALLRRMEIPVDLRNRVAPLILDHLVHLNPLSDRGVRRLADRLRPETIHGLVQLITADHSGRPPKPADAPPAAQELLERARRLAVTDRAPAPLIKGDHLLKRGLLPGPQMGVILREAYEAQLDGQIANPQEVERWLSAHCPPPRRHFGRPFRRRPRRPFRPSTPAQ